MTDQQSAAYASIGHAIVACQGLEMMFALCVRLAFKYQDAEALDEVSPLGKNFAKVPTKNLLDELRKYVEVSPAFEDRIADFIERRHTLIHRWSLERGFPVAASDFHALRSHSEALARDATELSSVMLAYIAEWLKKFPASRAEMAKSQLLSSIQMRDDLEHLRIERPNNSLERTRER